MVEYVRGAVTVRTPATSANLGPGYDTFGLALSLSDEITAGVTDGGLEVEVTGVCADDVPRDEGHLVVRAMRTAFEVLGGQPAGLQVSCRNAIPHGRGLGSSAAAIVGGLVLARALVVGGDDVLEDDQLLELATRLEGHPDNVAAAALGGLTLAWTDETGAHATRLDATAEAVVFVPPEPVSTQQARGLLPAVVPHQDAARNAGRAALLVVALTSRPDLLTAATRDWLHQEQRASAMPASHALLGRLRTAGVAAVISGAGPTVLAFLHEANPADLVAQTPDGWSQHTLQVEPRGARVVGRH